MVEKSHHVVVLIGAPLSGKGTQATLLSEMGYVNYDTGGIIRERKREKWRLLRDASENKIEDTDERVLDAHRFLLKIAAMAKGRNLADSFVLDLVHDAIPEHLPDKMVFTGFPRSKRQANWFIHSFVKPNQCLLSVIDLDVPEELLYDRCRKRKEKEGREDDNPSVVHTRLTEYQKYAPVVRTILHDYVRNYSGYARVDGSQSVTAIHSQIRKFIIGQSKNIAPQSVCA